MRSASIASPILTLHDDVLTEVALRLPAAKSKKPWRDMNSLATTCIRLYEWKKTNVDKEVLFEWERVKKKFANTKERKVYLEDVLNDFDGPSNRLYLEPVLRKIAREQIPLRTDKKMENIDIFITTLYSALEKVSYEDIRQLIVVLNKASFKTKKQLMAALQLFLPKLQSKYRQEILSLLFKEIDKDEILKYFLLKNGGFHTIGDSLGEDHQSKIVLLLSLISRKILSRHSDEYEFVLNYIPDEERWSWVLAKVPEYLNTTHGMHAMLDDPVCNTQMIAYLNNVFSNCSTEVERFSICERLSEFYPKFLKYCEGEKLVDELVHWFLRSPEFIVDENAPLNSRYIRLLSKHLTMYKTYFDKSKKNLLSEKISKAISYAGTVNAFDQSTFLLIEVAKTDQKLITNICRSSFQLVNKNALMDALLKNSRIKNIDVRYSFVSALCIAARYHCQTDPEFFQKFVEVHDSLLI